MRSFIVLLVAIPIFSPAVASARVRNERCRRCCNRRTSVQEPMRLFAPATPRIQYPRIVDVRTERQSIDGTWHAYANNEEAWADEKNRFVCVLEPNDLSHVKVIRFIKRPWGDPGAAWVEFGRATGGSSWSIGDLGVGNWIISAEVEFTDGRKASLHDPNN